MALVDTGIGDARKFGFVQLLDSCCATIAHTRAQATHHLIDYLLNGTFIGNTTGNTLGDKLLYIL